MNDMDIKEFYHFMLKKHKNRQKSIRLTAYAFQISEDEVKKAIDLDS